jgi:uncharacterized membrane protein
VSDGRREPLRTERGLERLVFFTDAVAAIAITLLVLPLVDIVPKPGEPAADLGVLLVTHTGQLFAFALSFVVIGRLWYAHHQVFEWVEGYNRAIVDLDLLWCLTIVLLPFPTAALGSVPTTGLTVLLYSGTLTVSSLALALIVVVLTRHPELVREGAPLPRERLLRAAVPAGLFLAATVLGTAFPDRVNFWPLLLLLLQGPVLALLRRTGRRGGGRPQP